ncbi:MAG: glycosyltransferase [Methylophaga sp.]|nr:glycosyltransferase [Methylophaga sp.]
MILVNLYNQKGAGPLNISSNLLKQIEAHADSRDEFLLLLPDIKAYEQFVDSRCNIIRLPCYKTIAAKIVFRIYLELIVLPKLIRRHRIDAILAFGNFLLTPSRIRKVVLLHHPYLVDDALLKKLPIFARAAEYCKRMAFFLTVRNVDVMAVQSDYMKEQFSSKYPKSSHAAQVIPNPVSDAISKVCSDLSYADLITERLATMKSQLRLIYVSRFYPHKNHRFLIALSERLNQRNIKHEIFVTVDPILKGAGDFLDSISSKSVSISNIGEQSQELLSEFYESSHAMIFPSSAETFGNPLIEALGFGLPVIAPKLDYAVSVLNDAGIYYAEDDVEDCVDQISTLFKDHEFYQQASSIALHQFQRYPNVSDWFAMYRGVIEAQPGQRNAN